jgi:hypothetical protein
MTENSRSYWKQRMDFAPVQLPVKLKAVPQAAQWHSWLAIGAIGVAQ